MATETELRRRIRAIKTELARLGDLRPGALNDQYTVCGTPSCRCKADPPQKHGPYHQLSYSRRGRSTTENIRPQDIPAVQAQIANYHRLRELIDEWIDVAIELDRQHRTKTAHQPRDPRRAPFT